LWWASLFFFQLQLLAQSVVDSVAASVEADLAEVDLGEEASVVVTPLVMAGLRQ